MRGNAAEHALISPGTLAGVLEVLAKNPGEYVPLAGGTELMVAHAAGRLPPSRFINLWGIEELRFIAVSPESITIGAGCTFSDIRASKESGADLPLLVRAASWIGSIANQNRASIGGNLVNGSPAADSSPALLVYDAELEIISARGSRRIPYARFHTGYKRNVLAPDELLFAVHLPRRFGQHVQYLRKVGTRRAMAVTKVALAGSALMKDGMISQIRLAAASLAAYPSRLYRAEAALADRPLTDEVIHEAEEALLGEIVPIDDIRSTAEYRRRVAANLLREFAAQCKESA